MSNLKLVKDCSNCPFHWDNEFGNGCNVSEQFTEKHEWIFELLKSCPLKDSDGVLVKMNKAKNE